MPWGSCRQTWRREGCPPLPHHLGCVEKFALPYLTSSSAARGVACVGGAAQLSRGLVFRHCRRPTARPVNPVRPKTGGPRKTRGKRAAGVRIKGGGAAPVKRPLIPAAEYTCQRLTLFSSVTHSSLTCPRTRYQPPRRSEPSGSECLLLPTGSNMGSISSKQRTHLLIITECEPETAT